MIHKIFPFADYNYWLKCLDNQINETTNQNYIVKFTSISYCKRLTDEKISYNKHALDMELLLDIQTLE